jgi:exopolysaccharide production protein ExoQ
MTDLFHAQIDAWQFSSSRPLSQSVESSSTNCDAPAWHLVLGWVLLIPLICFCENGTLVPNVGDAAVAATSGVPNNHGSASHMVTVAFVLLICSILILSSLPRVLAVGMRMKVLLALPTLAVVSCLWSEDPLQSVVSGMMLLIFTVFALYVGTRFSFQQQFDLIMLVGSVVLPLSIALALFVPGIGVSVAGWSGIFAQKQNCAGVCTLCLITALHWKCAGFYQKIFRTASILMSVLLIAMSQSRTGWALAFVALLLTATVWIMQRMPRKESLLVLLIGLAAAAGTAVAIHSAFSTILTDVGKDPTLSQRTDIWAAVWIEIIKHPILGYGYNAFWKGLYGPSHQVVVASGWDVFQAQDGFLDVWLSVGILGVGIIALMVWQSIKNAICAFQSQNETFVRWCIVIMICTLLFNIGESAIESLHMVWFFFLLAYIGLTQAAWQARSVAP